MTCQDARERLSLWIDGEPAWLAAGLALDERESLADHVRQCAECQDALKALEATVALIRGLPAIEAPLDVQTRALALGWQRAAEDMNAPVLARAYRPAPGRASAPSMSTVADAGTARGAPTVAMASPAPRSDPPGRGVFFWILVAAGILVLLVLTSVMVGVL